MVVSGGRREWRCCVAALRGALPLLHAYTCCSLCARRSVNISSCGRSACNLSLSTTTFVCSMDSSRAATSASLRLTSTCISLKRSIERCTHTRQGQRASNEQAQQATGSNTASKAATKRQPNTYTPASRTAPFSTSPPYPSPPPAASVASHSLHPPPTSVSAMPSPA